MSAFVPHSAEPPGHHFQEVNRQAQILAERARTIHERIPFLPAPWYFWVLVYLFELAKYAMWGVLVVLVIASAFRYRTSRRVYWATVAIVAMAYTPQGVEILRHYVQQQQILEWGRRNVPGDDDQTQFFLDNVVWERVQLNDLRYALYNFLNPFKSPKY